jgi:hypothetical protein
MRRMVLTLACVWGAWAPLQAQTQWDPVFTGPRGALFASAPEQTGVLFGSLALMQPSSDVTMLILWLRPLGDPGREFSVIAFNTAFQRLTRGPDLDSPEERLWVFSGQLQAGRYEIARAEFCMSSDVQKGFGPRPAKPPCARGTGPRPILVEVEAGTSTYLGRWLMSLQRRDPAESDLLWKEGHIFLRNAYEADLAIFQKKRAAGTIPPTDGPPANAVAEFVSTGR